MESRKIILSRKSIPTMEGAGVRLNRAFGHSDLPRFDPFLMLDDFRSDNPEHYRKGFPWHPHRGIETITYLIHGAVEHADSLGNKGVIRSGDVQWMTAGSGIIHHEMPLVNPDGLLSGFQLWANLPAATKMMKPRYQNIISSAIPEISTKENCKIRVICGTFDGTRGPVTDIITNPSFFDVSIPPQTDFILPNNPGYTVFCYVIGCSGYFCARNQQDSALTNAFADNNTLMLFGDGNHLAVHTTDSSLRFLFLSGKPIGEPIAWHGPIVMNTYAEIDTAFEEYQNGTFIK